MSTRVWPSDMHPDADGWMGGIFEVGVVIMQAPGVYRVRKWGKGDDPLDPDVYDTLEAAKFAVELKYG